MQPNTVRRIGIIAPSATIAEFKARTAEYGTTMSDVIKKCIQQYLATHPPLFAKRPKKEID